jgi:hypothetical protein
VPVTAALLCSLRPPHPHLQPLHLLLQLQLMLVQLTSQLPWTGPTSSRVLGVPSTTFLQQTLQ